MSAIIVGLAAVFFVYFIFGRKKKVKIPECYHCDSKDTLAYNDKAESFYCEFCGRVIDYDHVSLFYRNDFRLLTEESISKEDYERFKQLRKEGVELEKSRVASNKNIKG